MAITIRQAIRQDALLLYNLGIKTFADTFASQNTPENMAAYLASAFQPQKIATDLADPVCTYLIAENEEQVVGYARMYGGKPAPIPDLIRPVELSRIYSVQEYIGLGVGSALMSACLSKAAQDGYQTIWLGVWQNNPRAIAFYQKWDFRIVGTQVFQLGSDLQTDYLMQRPVRG